MEGKNNNRIAIVDIVKGIAIISVILLYTFSSEILLIIGAPFHIWQAVPIFILIAGFIWSHSLSRRHPNISGEVSGVKILYSDLSHFIRRFKRILLPFWVIFIVEIFAIFLILKENLTAFDIFSLFCSGGYGSGSYFIPVILQLIIIAPIIYWLAIKNPNRMLLFVFTISLLLEFLAIMLNISESSYRLLFIRYLFALALGVWFYLSKDQPIKLILCGAGIGFLYILFVNYLDFQFPFIFPAWRSQHAPSFFYTLLLVIVIFIVYSKIQNKKIFASIESMGIASWHIFLIQMAYFWTLGSLINKFIFRVLPKNLIFLDSINVITLIGWFFLVVINLVICIGIGYFFYQLESELSKRFNILK